MDDKDKSVISKLVDTVTNAVGGAVKAAVMPTVDPEEGVVAEKSYEQMLVGDAATAPEAVPAPTAQKKGKLRAMHPRLPKKLTKQVARPAKASAKKSKKIASKMSAKKTSKKTARKTHANKKAKKSKR